MKLVDAAKSLVRRLPEREGRKASLAHRLVAIQLNLIGFVLAPRSHIVDPCRPVRACLLLETKVELVEEGRLQRSARKRVQAYCQRACRGTLDNPVAGRTTRGKHRFEASLSIRGCVHRAATHPGRNPNAADLPANAAHKGRRVGRDPQSAPE